jgi:YgiT-type zinc finger domain-containing protein
MKETMVDTKVTYTPEYGGEFFIMENVPARVCRETGQQ